MIICHKGSLVTILNGKWYSSLNNLDYLAIILSILPKYLSLILVHFCDHLSWSNSSSHPPSRNTLKIVQVHRVRIFYENILFKPFSPLSFSFAQYRQPLLCLVWIVLFVCVPIKHYWGVLCIFMFLIIINITYIHSFKNGTEESTLESQSCLPWQHPGPLNTNVTIVFIGSFSSIGYKCAYIWNT